MNNNYYYTLPETSKHLIFKLDTPTPIDIIEKFFKDTSKIQIMRTEKIKGIKLPKIIRVFDKS